MVRRVCDWESEGDTDLEHADPDLHRDVMRCVEMMGAVREHVLDAEAQKPLDGEQNVCIHR